MKYKETAEERTYTAQQIKSGDYDISLAFGYVLPNPLPFRLMAFDETEIDGIYIDSVYCGETLDDVYKSVAYRYASIVIGVYQFQPNGRTWHLIPDSWVRGAVRQTWPSSDCGKLAYACDLVAEGEQA